MNPPTDPHDYVRQRLAECRPRFAYRPGLDVDAFRAALSDTLGGVDGWERAPLDVEVEESVREEGWTRERITFGTRPGLRACGYLLTPDAPSGAAVVALPGHGLGADAVAGVRDDDYQAQFGVQCVRRGYTTLVLEQVSFGRRRDAQAAALGGGASSCVRDSMAALMLGESMTGWRVFDTMRALDLLSDRPEVDPARLATLGISGGGLTSLFTAALDVRVAVCGVSGYFNTFAGSILAVDHCVDNYVPGLQRLCEMPDMTALIAPRTLALETGRDDPIFPLATFESALAVARRVYADAGAADNLTVEVFESDHRFHGVGLFATFAVRL